MFHQEFKPKPCRRCKKSFTPKVDWQRYCGKSCRDAVANKKRADIVRQARKIVAQATVNG